MPSTHIARPFAELWYDPTQWVSVLKDNPYLNSELRSLYHGAKKPRVATPDQLKSERYVYRSSPVRIEIIAYLRKHGTGTNASIAKATGRSRSRIAQWLPRLAAEGLATVEKHPGIGPDVYTWRGHAGDD